ncbi:MAG: DEAD/DEAH box helicase [Paludibacteraceae bacterium]|nr:DEAD/DEAH box helicase [Paludibacteraceae bacterium]MBR2451537.1 DEAD/DEAH box helicase [Paludibacteraceae bacterium]
MYFDELALSDEVLDALWDMRFDTCTPVQEQTIPVILDGHDVISCAQTGTGKTAAYILPLLTNLQYDNHDPNKLNAIIMAPTRELAQQIDQQMEGFGFYVPFSSVAIYGGNDSGAWGTQVTGLQKGADIVIATPGRLLSQMNIYDIDFSGVKYFILDEADRMLDMGFYDDIMTIVNKLPKDRQTIMFSATMPTNIRKMAKAIMQHPVEVQIAISRPPESIRQMAADIYETQKTAFLVRLLGFGLQTPDTSEKLKKVIIFVGKKQKVKELTRALRANHINARAMHSDLEQKERDEVMLDFRNGKVDVLVATDIVSRGIDVDDIPLVINYDVPRDAEDYVHRIGRTARAENKGEAITLVSPEDKRFFYKIERFLQKIIDRVPLPAELGAAPDSSVCSLAADDRKPSSKRRKGGWHAGHNRKPKHNRPKVRKQ